MNIGGGLEGERCPRQGHVAVTRLTATVDRRGVYGAGTARLGRDVAMDLDDRGEAKGRRAAAIAGAAPVSVIVSLNGPSPQAHFCNS